MDENTDTTNQTPDDGAPAASSGAATTGDATATKTGHKRTWLIAGGIAAAVVLLGGGIAIGAAISDDDDDDDARPQTSVSSTPTGEQSSAAPTTDDDDTDDDETAPATALPGGDIGTASADDLIAITDAARGVADGDVTSIDAKRSGAWEVELVAADLTEFEVRVNQDGTAELIAQDPADNDDIAPTLVLDDATIRSLTDAALAEADGAIVDMSADDRTYDVTVRTGARNDVEIEFDTDFAVVGFDRD